MRAFALIGALLLAVLAGNVPCAKAQPAASDQAKGMVGTWELSDADRDRTCSVTFKLDAAKVEGLAPVYAVAMETKCGNLFPPLRDVAAWTFDKNDMLLLVDTAGKSVLELLEVEAGTYEGLRPNEGRYVLQNASVVAADRGRTADQMFGDWTFMRGAKPICALTLANTAADADSFALTVKPGCDALITRFGPASWRVDRGQLALANAKGDIWRFEEGDDKTWHRVPEGRPAIVLVKQ